MTFYLIYVSTAIKIMTDDELLFLLKEAREKNLGLDITGMLLYKGGNFMQMLEGDKQTVLELYDTIAKDDRHKDSITVITGDTKNRSFQGWSMGFFNMDKSDELPKFNDYIEENLTLRSFQDEAKHAYEYITFFNENNR